MHRDSDEDLNPDTVVPGIDGTTGLPLGESAAERPEARFGERLRAVARSHSAQLSLINPGDLRELADAIDQDATFILAAYHDELMKIYEREVAYARQRIKEAVERLRYSVINAAGRTAADRRHTLRDVVDAELLLAELDRIFGIPEGSSGT